MDKIMSVNINQLYIKYTLLYVCMESIVHSHHLSIHGLPISVSRSFFIHMFLTRRVIEQRSY